MGETTNGPGSGGDEAQPGGLAPALERRIRGWIDELPAQGESNWLARYCQQIEVLPLHSTLIYLWALKLDGSIVRIDHGAFGLPTEPETDPLVVYAVLVQGANRHPELAELAPAQPAGARRCERCAGAGWVAGSDGSASSDLCFSCSGLGWRSDA